MRVKFEGFYYKKRCRQTDIYMYICGTNYQLSRKFSLKFKRLLGVKKIKCSGLRGINLKGWESLCWDRLTDKMIIDENKNYV